MVTGAKLLRLSSPLISSSDPTQIAVSRIYARSPLEFQSPPTSGKLTVANGCGTISNPSLELRRSSARRPRRRGQLHTWPPDDRAHRSDVAWGLLKTIREHIVWKTLPSYGMGARNVACAIFANVALNRGRRRSDPFPGMVRHPPRRLLTHVGLGNLETAALGLTAPSDSFNSEIRTRSSSAEVAIRILGRLPPNRRPRAIVRQRR